MKRNNDSFLDLVFLVFLLFFTSIILGQNQVVIWDQQFVLNALTPFKTGWPSFDAGITSNLIVNIFGLLFHPTPQTVNGLIRALAGGALLVVFYAFLRVHIKSRNIRIFGLSILVASGYPFLWLSSEIFAAVFLFCFFLLILKEPAMILAGISAGLAALCKPDLLLPIAAISIMVIVQNKSAKARKKYAGALLLTLAILNLPGIIENGISKQLLANRGFMALSQHFAEVASFFQLQQPPLEPWGNPGIYMKALMPGATSFFDIAFKHTNLYLMFLSLSIGHLIVILTTYLNFFLAIFLGLLIFKFKSPKSWEKMDPRVLMAFKFVGVSLVGFVPIILLTYPHTRYLARYFPLFLATGLLFLDSLKRAKLKAMAMGLLFLGIFIQPQSRDTWRAITHPRHYEMFWFLD